MRDRHLLRGGMVTRRWTRHGNHRLYVSPADGRQVGGVYMGDTIPTVRFAKPTGGVWTAVTELKGRKTRALLPEGQRCSDRIRRVCPKRRTRQSRHRHWGPSGECRPGHAQDQ